VPLGAGSPVSGQTGAGAVVVVAFTGAGGGTDAVLFPDVAMSATTPAISRTPTAIRM